MKLPEEKTVAGDAKMSISFDDLVRILDEAVAETGGYYKHVGTWRFPSLMPSPIADAPRKIKHRRRGQRPMWRRGKGGKR